MIKNYKVILLILLFVTILILILIYRINNSNNTENFVDNVDNKVAFLFLTRNNLKRLDIWEDFFKGNESKYNIYCHAKEPEKVTDKLLKDNIIPEHIETCWGCINLVEANLISMKNALLNTQNKKFILVSESCIPIVSFDTFYKTIMNDDKSRIGIHKNNSTPERYQEIINPTFQEKDFIKHSGSGCIFNRLHAQMLVYSMPNLKNWEKQKAPDEHYNGNILLVMDKEFNDNNNNIKTTFDIWQKKDLNLPNLDDNIKIDNYILLSEVSNEAIANMRENGFLFIRKIDEKTVIDKNYILQ
jgi:hypothetical protein